MQVYFGSFDIRSDGSNHLKPVIAYVEQ